jgi:arylformamidase
MGVSQAASFGGDAARLFICGHSSGAHLAAVALTTDWPATAQLSPDVLKGGLCCSGSYDLKAPRLSARSRAAGKPVQLLVGEQHNHFEIIETLANPYGLLGRAMPALMGIVRR